MFSGIVAGAGRVASLTSGEPGIRLIVHAPELLDDVVDGESVAVNGACLTAAGRPAPDELAFDLMPETLRRSNLGGLVAGDSVNLERSLRFGDRIGGHLVQGHIDGIAEVVSVVPEGDARLLRVRLREGRLARAIVEKGFVTVDGVSLTVVRSLPDGFVVSLVRTTLELTTLGAARPGTIVNVEVDLFARHLLDGAPAPRPLAAADGSPPGEGDPSVAITAALDALRAGRPVLVLDDEDRENEGDLVLAAEFATAEWLAFLIREAGGFVCVAMDGGRLDALDVPLMVDANTSRQGTAFTVSVDAATVSTGVSAAERAATVRTLIDPATRPADLVRPGHVFPLRAVDGGLRERRGHTEAAVELCRLAGLEPAAVIVEVMNPDGTMARRPELAAFAAANDLSLITVGDIAGFDDAAGEVRPQGRSVEARGSVVRVAESSLPTEHGRFRMIVYGAGDGLNDLALVLGQPDPDNALVRVHSECLTGDVLGSLRCDCGPQREQALATIAAAGSGILVYLRQEGRGIGLANKARAYALQDAGLDTVDANLALGFPADLRDYGRAAAILADLGVDRVCLLTNNPAKVQGLEAAGIRVLERRPLEVVPGQENAAYLATKRTRLGHLLETNR
ncbi:MAG: GTP cyclohydrolase II [Chloroflexi bacterium]|nr:GTP cyclohydrolase II [Chloroflexota bacterium]